MIQTTILLILSPTKKGDVPLIITEHLFLIELSLGAKLNSLLQGWVSSEYKGIEAPVGGRFPMGPR